MGLYGIKLKNVGFKDSKIVIDSIDKTNFRLDGDDQANFFISGRITVRAIKKDLILICNIRPLLHIPFFRSIFIFALKRSLKKEGYKGSKPKYMSFNDFSKVLEGVL